MYRCTCIITLVSWCRLRRRRNEIIFFFSCLQLDALRSLKMNSTTNIIDNYRPVQNLGSRKVKSSLSSTQAAGYYRCSCPNRSCKRCSQNIQCPFDVGALPGRSFLPLNDLQDQVLCLRGRGKIMPVFLYSLGAVQVGLGNVFVRLDYIFSSTFATLFLLDFIFQYSYRYQSNSWELLTL